MRHAYAPRKGGDTDAIVTREMTALHLVARIQIGERRPQDPRDGGGRQRDEQAVHDGVEIFPGREEGDVVGQTEPHARVAEVEVGLRGVVDAETPRRKALHFQPFARRGLKQRAEHFLFYLETAGARPAGSPKVRLWEDRTIWPETEESIEKKSRPERARVMTEGVSWRRVNPESVSPSISAGRSPCPVLRVKAPPFS